MRLKASKQEVLNYIRDSALNEIKKSFYVENMYYSSTSHVDINAVISHAISNGIMAGFEAYMSMQYTDEDFESDLGLR